MVDSAGAGQNDDVRAASRADGEVQVLSTDAVPLRERFSYWREVVCTAARGFFGTPTTAQPGRFSARVTVRTSGPIRLMEIESKAYQIVRTRRDVANAPRDHYGFHLQLSGKLISIPGEEAIEFDAGDIGFCQGPEYRAKFGGRCTVVLLPRAMLERRAPWLRDRPQGRFASTARFADHLRLHMLELTNWSSPLGESQISLLADSFCNLVALAAADGIPGKSLQPELQLEALLAFCRDNLHRHDLSPQHAADHLGISLRTLHSRFGQIGQTFGRWVLQSRLEACARALRDPNQGQLMISEIAYRWGFNDLSHFNRAFRAQFGITPGDWRNGPTAS